MNIGIILNTNDLEEAWNAFRFGVKALEKGRKQDRLHAGLGEVYMYLGILESKSDAKDSWFQKAESSLKQAISLFPYKTDYYREKFDMAGMMRKFRENKGIIMTCGTCLKSRNKPGTALCPINTLDDLMQLVETADKVISFG